MAASSESRCYAPSILTSLPRPFLIQRQSSGRFPNRNNVTAGLPLYAACKHGTTSQLFTVVGLHDGSLQDALDMLTMGNSWVVVTMVKTLKGLMITFCSLC